MIGELVGLKFQVGIHDTEDANRGVKVGHAKYPNFNLVSQEARKGMDWSKYIDVHGIGMQYDKTSGHQDHTNESPFGEQTCVIAVPEDFANEALSMFSFIVELTEQELEDFYNDKAHAHEDDEHLDADVLTGLKVKKELMEGQGLNTAAMDAKIRKALDPNDQNERGVRKNKNKSWSDFKANKGLTIKANV
jgi:hypothetical protein